MRFDRDRIAERAEIAGREKLGERRFHGDPEVTHAHLVNVIWMVLGPSLRVTLTGITLGVAGAYTWNSLLQSLLFDVSMTDGVTFVGVPIAFVLVAMIASLAPAWRASRLDPNVVLRGE
jgi:ABC-type lipoprotein release transport system permease subunit